MKKISSELSIIGENLTGKYVVINERIMKEQYKDLKYRIVKASGGFGCNPDLIGKAVFAVGLDGENARWSRGDFIRFATNEEVENAIRELGQNPSIL